MNHIKHRVTTFLLLTLILITVSYYYIDRPLVNYLAAHHSRHITLLQHMANDIISLLIGSMILFYAYFMIKLTKQTLTTLDRKLIIACNAIVIAIFLKSELKAVFGRAWANTFVCNNPSFLQNHVYGFHWFADSSSFGSFPSGHATAISAFSTSMWFLFPRFRILWCALAGCVFIGQVGMYYHFLSDAIAGIALGGIVAVYNNLYCKGSPN